MVTSATGICLLQTLQEDEFNFFELLLDELFDFETTEFQSEEYINKTYT